MHSCVPDPVVGLTRGSVEQRRPSFRPIIAANGDCMPLTRSSVTADTNTECAHKHFAEKLYVRYTFKCINHTMSPTLCPTSGCHNASYKKHSFSSTPKHSSYFLSLLIQLILTCIQQFLPVLVINDQCPCAQDLWIITKGFLNTYNPKPSLNPALSVSQQLLPRSLEPCSVMATVKGSSCVEA